MPRPESPLDPDAGVLQRFAYELREVRARAGSPPYRELARRAHFSAATLAKAANGTSLPNLAVTLAYVRACDGDVAGWEARWREVCAETVFAPPVAAAPECAEDLPCPYPGAAALGRADATRFRRDRVLGELVAALDRHRLVVVIGPTGCGKSSLLNAGLPAAFARDRDVTVHAVCPGQECLPARMDDTDVLLVVDGVEELFTTGTEAARARFVDLLLAAVRSPAGRTRAVLGLRSDAEPSCVRYLELAGAPQVEVGPATVEELRTAVVHPASQSGCIVEGALVTQLVGEVAGQPGALALTALVMAQTWLRRRGNALTLAGYRECGGLTGVLAAVAEQHHADSAPEDRDRLRAVLLRLVAVGESTRATTRRARRAEFDAPDLSRILEELAAARLVVLDRDVVELAHRGLVDGWPRLRQWIDDDHDGLRVHRHLTEAAQAWESLHREPAALYNGTRLAAACAWADANGSRLSTLEREYLDRSTAKPTAGRAVRRRPVAGLVAAAVIIATTVVVAVQPEPGPAEGTTGHSGRAELVGVDTRLRVWPNTGALPDRPWGAPVDLDFHWPSPSRLRFADLDGDRRDDLVTINSDGTIIGWRTEHGLPDQPWRVSGEIGREWGGDPAAIHFADLDGDGRTELIGVDTADEPVLYAWRNNGSFPGWPWDGPISLGSGWVDITAARFADLTGDGRAELISISEHGLRVWPNNGAFPGWPWGDPVEVGRAGADDPTFADLDGDRYADLVSVTPSGLAWRRNDHSFPATPWEDPVAVGTGEHTPEVIRFADLVGDAVPGR